MFSNRKSNPELILEAADARLIAETTQDEGHRILHRVKEVTRSIEERVRHAAADDHEANS